MAWWLGWLVWLALAVNVTQIVYNSRLMRRWQRLNRMLFALCCQAVHLRHGPIWQAWSDAMGCDIRVRLETVPQRKLDSP
jgi:hypothetical protein